MIEVKILDISVSEIVDIVKDVRLKGYVQGVDFDFEYHPPKFDNFSGDAVYNRCVIFTSFPFISIPFPIEPCIKLPKFISKGSRSALDNLAEINAVSIIEL